jgi:hypothetical protein
MLVYVPQLRRFSKRGAGRRTRRKLDRDLPGRICASVSKDLHLPFHDLRPIVQKMHLEGDALRLTGDYHYASTLSSRGRSICGAWQI